jgi:phasin
MSVMTEATAATPEDRTAKHTADPFGFTNYKMPNFELPKMEVTEAFSEFAEKGVAQAKDIYGKAKAVTEEATDILKNTYATAANGATNYNLKLLEIARTNTNAAFDYANELFGVKSMAEFVELSTAHARKQFETLSDQTKELAALAQKVATETGEPLNTGVTRYSTRSPEHGRGEVAA